MISVQYTSARLNILLPLSDLAQFFVRKTEPTNTNVKFAELLRAYTK